VNLGVEGSVKLSQKGEKVSLICILCISCPVEVKSSRGTLVW